ncbi:hypothetical protein ABZW96_09255 [Nocardia sp. NPDC004168]|uniref:hypothetical protein n=1 Tax=Nocardia sp. NPDC004168 TaxID=3154452 RepID=UPI0033AEB451
MPSLMPRPEFDAVGPRSGGSRKLADILLRGRRLVRIQRAVVMASAQRQPVGFIAGLT